MYCSKFGLSFGTGPAHWGSKACRGVSFREMESQFWFKRIEEFGEENQEGGGEGGHPDLRESPQRKPVRQEWETVTAFSGHVIVISHYCRLQQHQTDCSGWSCLCKLIFFSKANLSLLAWTGLFVQRDTQRVLLLFYLHSTSCLNMLTWFPMRCCQDSGSCCSKGRKLFTTINLCAGFILIAVWLSFTCSCTWSLSVKFCDSFHVWSSSVFCAPLFSASVVFLHIRGLSCGGLTALLSL